MTNTNNSKLAELRDSAQLDSRQRSGRGSQEERKQLKEMLPKCQPVEEKPLRSFSTSLFLPLKL